MKVFFIYAALTLSQVVINKSQKRIDCNKNILLNHYLVPDTETNLHKKIIACTFFLLITLLVKSQNTLQWIKINSGNEIPANAVVGGKDGDGSPLFVAHGNYEGITSVQ